MLRSRFGRIEGTAAGAHFTEWMVFEHRVPLHVRQGNVGLAFGRDAGVVKTGDVRMRKRREDVTLAPQPLCERPGDKTRVRELERDLALEHPVDTEPVSSFVPGALQQYDLPDLDALIAPRPCIHGNGGTLNATTVAGIFKNYRLKAGRIVCD